MSSDFIQMAGKTILVFGVANKKSVAYAAARNLEECGVRVIYAVRDQEVRDKVSRLLPERPVIVCDVESDSDMADLEPRVREQTLHLDGIVHSIAFANYSQGMQPFEKTVKQDFLQAVDISCFSLLNIVNQLERMLTEQAAIVTISISTTRLAADNYGYMAPIKAALNSSVAFLAKSLGKGTRRRVNAVGAGLLKTASSAGIPGYVDSYLFAEKVIPRGAALQTGEVADTVTYLLSSRSSGINGQVLIVDAGMELNYFDPEIVRGAVGSK